MGAAYLNHDSYANEIDFQLDCDRLMDAYRILLPYHKLSNEEIKKIEQESLGHLVTESPLYFDAEDQKKLQALKKVSHAAKVGYQQSASSSFATAINEVLFKQFIPPAKREVLVSEFLISEWDEVIEEMNSVEDFDFLISSLTKMEMNFTQVLILAVTTRHPKLMQFESRSSLARHYLSWSHISLSGTEGVVKHEFSLSFLIHQNPQLANDTETFLKKLRREDRKIFDELIFHFSKFMWSRLQNLFYQEFMSIHGKSFGITTYEIQNNSYLFEDIFAFKKVLLPNAPEHLELDQAILDVYSIPKYSWFHSFFGDI